MARSSNQVRAQLWQSRLRQFSKTQLTVEQFCNSVNCSTPTFYYWKRKLSESSSDWSTVPTRSIQSSESAFVPVTVRQNHSQCVVVQLPDGTKIEMLCDPLSALELILQNSERVS